MHQLYDKALLPNQQQIAHISQFANDFLEDDYNYSELIARLREAYRANNLMQGSDYKEWFIFHGKDYIHNPKLLSTAPLMQVFTLISEIFKNFDNNRIIKELPAEFLLLALVRIKSFRKSNS